MPNGISFNNNLVIYPNMNVGDNNSIVPPNAPLKGVLSHQPRVTPWGNRNVTTDAPYRGKSFIVGEMLMPLRGGIITRHTTPRALP